jgi:hypothetical protein
MSTGITEAPAAGIGKLIMDNRFSVPNHQRDYSWTDDEIRQLFDDIELALDKGSGVYFLGLMVFLTNPAGRLVVLDGQQRLATAVIIFSAIRGWLAQYSEYQSDAAKIQEWFIGRSELGQKYAAIDSADDAVWSIYPTEARATVRSLRLLGSQQAHPVILSALNSFDPKETAKLLELLEVIIVRYLLIGGGNTGRFETTCAILARKIHSKEIKTASAAFQELKDVYPSDDDFKQAFRVKQERSNQKAQYFLKRIEQEAIRQKSNKMPELTPGNLTVEHVLPRNPGADWSSVTDSDPAIKDDCSTRIGNTCLLTDSGNNKLGGKSFSEKRKIFEASDLITTKAIAAHTTWDRQNIDHHQAYLAKLAASTWRFQ